MTTQEAAVRAYQIGASYRLKRDSERAREIAWDTEMRFTAWWSPVLRRGAREAFSKILSEQDNGPLTLRQARTAFMAGALGESLQATIQKIGEWANEA